MTLIKHFDTFINEAHKGDAKKYKQWWDKGPETQIRRKFGKDYEKSIDNRVNLLLTLVDDPDKAEEYAEMDFLSLPNGISTQLVNMDPKELHAILDESVLNEAATDINVLASELGTQFPKMSKMKNWVRDVVVEDDYKGGVIIMVSGLAGDSTPKKEVNTVLKKLGWKTKYVGRENYSTSYGSGNGHTYTWQLKGAKDTDLKPDWGNKWDIDESVVNEARANTAKAALRNASDALKQTIPGSKIPKAYVKDYLESLERMAKKLPQLFVKQYGDFTINDYIEDVEYNMRNESVSEAKRESNEELMFNFLEALRASGATNMFGAAPYLQDSFGLSKSEAKKVLVKWMKSFESVTEARVDGKTIDGLTSKLAKIVKELKDNFVEYKKAKTDADKKKWTERARELTGLKQSTMDGLHKAIETFHKDVEYDETFESFLVLESTIGIKTSGTAEVKYMAQIKKDLDKAKIKYKFNRLSLTLSVIDVDKKDFKNAKKIVDDSELTILMAKESRVSI